MRFVLASASPRRKELLEQIGMEFTIQVSDVDEVTASTEPAEYVMELAAMKAEDVAGKIPVMYDTRDINQDYVVIGSDTVVAVGNEILGKPVDEEDACRMLRMIAGNTHQVYTGVALVVFRDNRIERNVFFEKTDVTMYDMTDEEIRQYVASKEPMDKAGSYAIQGRCAAYVKGIQGEYASVVGLPVARICHELKKMNIRWCL